MCLPVLGSGASSGSRHAMSISSTALLLGPGFGTGSGVGFGPGGDVASACEVIALGKGQFCGGRCMDGTHNLDGMVGLAIVPRDHLSGIKTGPIDRTQVPGHESPGDVANPSL